MKTVTLSVRDFALPVPRVGSIETHSGYGHVLADGQEIHSRVQQKRLKAEPLYESEVSTTHTFEHEGYHFQVNGRMDGFWKSDPPRIEEIKSCFNTGELKKKLSHSPMEHPYCLQLQAYGYIYWLQNQVIPELSLHLVSTRNQDSDDLKIKMDLPALELWANRRLDELVQEEKRREKQIERRKKIAKRFEFPFETPRPGQTDLVQMIEEGMETGVRMLIQAPTGLGKTAGVLYPALKEALSRGQKVIYVTPKNSQHAVAEDAVRRFQDTGSPIKSLTITAKSKICLKSEPLCNPEYCEYSKDYYQKVDQNGLAQILARKKKLNARVFRTMAEEYQVCPFELQFEAAEAAETLICDYNYVFAPRSSLERMTGVRSAENCKPNLVIDEAHNLPFRAMDYYSPSLSSAVLEKMKKDVSSLPSRFRSSAEELLDDCVQVLILCRPDGESQSKVIEPPASIFLDQDFKIRSYLSRYLEGNLDINPGDVVLRLSLYWSGFTAALDFVADPSRDEFFTTFHPHPSGGIIKITCCDASEMLKASYDNYHRVVGFSATLKPFEYYSLLSGLDFKQIKTAEFQSPFPKANRKLLIIPQISTKYSDRQRNYSKIAEAIQKIVALRRGNYFVFFPSFDFLERVFELFQTDQGFLFLKQERYMKPAQVEEVLVHLKERATPTLVFGVQGGVFSEGVDYPGDMIIGAFVVGPPLPSFDLEREKMRAYYQEHYGSGFDYAYTFPAMAKSVQAAGRVIRSETDRGLIVLMDSRFVQPSYTKSMPSEWFETNPLELVSQGILKEIDAFWKASED